MITKEDIGEYWEEENGYQIVKKLTGGIV